MVVLHGVHQSPRFVVRGGAAEDGFVGRRNGPDLFTPEDVRPPHGARSGAPPAHGAERPLGGWSGDARRTARCAAGMDESAPMSMTNAATSTEIGCRSAGIAMLTRQHSTLVAPATAVGRRAARWPIRQAASLDTVSADACVGPCGPP